MSLMRIAVFFLWTAEHSYYPAIRKGNNMHLPGERSLGMESYEKTEFEVGGRPVTVACPEHPVEGRIGILVDFLP